MTERRLSPADACWLYSDFEGNHQTVSALLWLDRQIDPADFRRVVQERLLDQYPTFTQRIRKSRNPLLMPHWEDDPDFDLDYHLDVIELPSPGDKEQLEALVSEQRSQMLDHSKPLWRFHLIQGYRGASAIHARIQHSIADGWALVRLVMSLADEAEQSPPVEVVERERRRKRDTALAAAQPAIDAIELARGAAENLADSASRAVDAVAETVRNPAGIPARLASSADAMTEALALAPDPQRFLEFGSQVPGMVSDAAARVAEVPGMVAEVPGMVADQVRPVTDAAGAVAGGAGDAIDFLNSPKPGKTILHGTVSGKKKVAWIEPMPLGPIKEAGKALDATINDLLMGASTNALRLYLLEHNALNVENLMVSVPISLRKADDPLPRELGNRFGLVNVLLPVGIADPVDQVRAIKAQIDEIKDSQLPIVSFGLVSVAAITTPDVERLIHKITQEQSTGVVTNVIGPREQLTLAGAKVVGAWGMGGVGGNMNVCLAIFSLNGEINFAVASDTAITTDPERILDLFQESVGVLIERAGASA